MIVKVFKLVSGEEVIARVVDIGEDYYILSKPRVFQLVPQQNGSVAAGLIPWFISSPDADDVALIKTAIAGVIDATKEVEDAYLRNTTGFELASSLVGV